MSADHSGALEFELEKLRKKCIRLQKAIKANTVTKGKLMAKIARVQSHMERVIERLTKRQAAAREYEKTIMEVNFAYEKIVKATEILLEMLREQAGESDVEEIVEETYGDIMDVPLDILNDPFADEDEQEAERRKYNFHKFHDGEAADTSVWKKQGDENHHMDEAKDDKVMGAEKKAKQEEEDKKAAEAAAAQKKEDDAVASAVAATKSD